MVGHTALDRGIGVRIPASQPIQYSHRSDSETPGLLSQPPCHMASTLGGSLI